MKITEGQKDVTLGLLEGGGDSRGVGVGGGGGSWVVGGWVGGQGHRAPLEISVIIHRRVLFKI